tara:strand:+ start:3133 stop:3615 length:483 start_codon:yes stop_codon:yes gene_type:complete
MAITQAVCNTFKQEVLMGVHDIRNGGTGDALYLALYTSSATLSKASTAYSASNEAVDSNSNYVAGGEALTVPSGGTYPALSGDTAFVTFSDVTISNASMTANGALVYNSTPSALQRDNITAYVNPAVCVLAFGGDKTSTDGDFTIQFPTADASNAIIRIG